MKTRGATRLALTLAIALACGACNTIPSVADTDGTFEDSLRTYTKMVRWGEFERAALFVKPEMRERFVALARDFENVRFTDYELGPIEYGEDGEHASVTVTYRAYDEATLVEQVITEDQTWESSGMRTWFVVPDFEGFAGLKRADRAG